MDKQKILEELQNDTNGQLDFQKRKDIVYPFIWTTKLAFICESCNTLLVIFVIIKYFLRAQRGRDAIVYPLMVPPVVIVVNVLGYASPHLAGGVNRI